ncbi:hypothetical protein GCM10010435_32400 [Winogradskya consettensis]|uniref:Uncharacterized protein n=1 Tax=Winogradskya consettensis TaxID=113560 RepID=A0A919VUS4_9ACTN|nr:hypothetical protein Aco04nite_19090 [Actinoplanes consettensis]
MIGHSGRSTGGPGREDRRPGAGGPAARGGRTGSPDRQLAPEGQRAGVGGPAGPAVPAAAHLRPTPDRATGGRTGEWQMRELKRVHDGY